MSSVVVGTIDMLLLLTQYSCSIAVLSFTDTI